MKQISIEMPVVSQCSVAECAYNSDNGCRAKAITVGDSAHPGCDTYLCMPDGSSGHVRAKQQIAGVGACKVSACQYNEDYECVADGIMVGHASDQVNCLTYRRR